MQAKRGNNGGYVLARSPREITVGQVIRLFQRDAEVPEQPHDTGLHPGDFAFAGLWNRIQTAVSGVYDKTTFEDLLQDELLGLCADVPDYVI